jgi:pimeloyl-ACP methyl ester carboxylesterase
MESIFFDTNGIRLHAIQAGPEGGPLIILLHGFPEFWRGWIRQIEALAEAGFYVLAPDQRGYNLSDKPQNPAAYHLHELSKDILELIRATGRKKALLVGHDWGGIVAWWLGIYYPELLDRLVVLNAPHPGVMRKTLFSSLDQLRRSSYAFFFQLPWIPEAVSRNNDWELVEKALCKSSRPGTFSLQDFEQYRAAWWRKGAFTAMLNWYRANLRNLAQFPENLRVSVPSLLLWGTQDFALGQQMAGPSIDMCDQGRLVLFDQATHWIQHEEAEQVNQLIIEFASGGKL